jgi:hypothetical protein
VLGFVPAAVGPDAVLAVIDTAHVAQLLVRPVPDRHRHRDGGSDRPTTRAKRAASTRGIELFKYLNTVITHRQPPALRRHCSRHDTCRRSLPRRTARGKRRPAHVVDRPVRSAKASTSSGLERSKRRPLLQQVCSVRKKTTPPGCHPVPSQHSPATRATRPAVPGAETLSAHGAPGGRRRLARPRPGAGRHPARSRGGSDRLPHQAPTLAAAALSCIAGAAKPRDNSG